MDEPAIVLEPVGGRRRRRGRFVALVVTAVVGLAAAWTILTGWPAGGAPSRLAVIDSDGRLATMTGDGQAVRRFDLPDTRFQFPAWSPDGSRLAAVGSDGSNGSVFVVDPDADGEAAISQVYSSPDRPPFYVFWTPDGGNVSFLTTEPDGLALRIAPADGSSPAGVVRRGQPFYWDFVDSGRLLVHVGGVGSEAFVGEVGLDGTSLDGSAIAAGFFRVPVVGAGGRYRAYVRPLDGSRPGDGQELIVEERNGDVRHAIPVHGNAAIAFDPGASVLAFIAAVAATSPTPPLPIGPLRIVEPDSGDVRTLVDADVVAFFLAPDGGTVATLEIPGRPDGAPNEASRPGLQLAATGPAPAATDRPGVVLHLRFTDVDDGTTRSQRDVRVSDLFVAQLLPFFDQYALSHRLWSPDSGSIVLPIVEPDGSVAIMLVGSAGSEPRPIADGVMGFWSP